MGVFNSLLDIELLCPRCLRRSSPEVAFYVGEQGSMDDYRIGDRLRWRDGDEEPAGKARNSQWTRPPNGTVPGEAYGTCNHCDKDYFLVLHVVDDMLVRLDVDLRKIPHGNDHECTTEPAVHVGDELRALRESGVDADDGEADDTSYADSGFARRIVFDGPVGPGVVYVTTDYEHGARVFRLNYPFAAPDYAH